MARASPDIAAPRNGLKRQASGSGRGTRLRRHVVRLVALLLLCTAALQLYFVARIALMAVLAPQSTSFQRSEAWRLLVEKHRIDWRQDWVNHDRISTSLKRAVIASEDARFADHGGVEWDALEQAWEKNQRAEAVAARRNAQIEQRAAGHMKRAPRVRQGRIDETLQRERSRLDVDCPAGVHEIGAK